MFKLIGKTTAVLLVVCMICGVGAIPAAANNYEILAEADMTELVGKTGTFYNYTGVFSTQYPQWALQGSWRYSYSVPGGVYGKAADDYSTRIAITENPDNNAVDTYMDAWVITGGGDYVAQVFEDGDIIDFGWQSAFGMLRAAPRMEFQGTGYSNNAQFISVSGDGTVTFAGANRGIVPGWGTERWYDFRIILKFGTPTTASLYIDGYPYAENIKLTEGLMETIARFRLRPNGTSVAKGASSESYFDNVFIHKYTDGQEPESLEVNIETNADSILQSGSAMLAFDRSMTVGELLDSLSGDFQSVSFVKSDYTIPLETDEITDGYIKVIANDGREVLRDVALQNPEVLSESFDAVTEEYEGAISDFLTGSWHNTSVAGSIGGKDASDLSLVMTTEEFDHSHTGYAKPYFNYVAPYTYKGQWTYEVSVYKSHPASHMLVTFPVTLSTGGEQWHDAISLTGVGFNNRWGKVAVTFDTVAKTATTYLNGVLHNTKTIENLAGVYRMKMEVNYFAASAENKMSGIFAVDDVKFYMGAYNPSEDIINIEGTGDTHVGARVIRIPGTMTKATFISSLSTNASGVKIFDDETYTSTEIADSFDEVGAGQIAVLTSQNGETMKYYTIEEGPSFDISDITFETDQETGEVTANVSISSLDPLQNKACLILAAYQGNKLLFIDSETKTNIGETAVNLSATLDTTDLTDYTIKAFLWGGFGTMVPLSEVTPYTTP